MTGLGAEPGWDLIARSRARRGQIGEALREYIAHRQRIAAVEAFGTIDFDPEYDYKRAQAGR